MNGVVVGSIEDNGEDMDVKLRSSVFRDDVNLEKILSLPIPTANENFALRDFVDSTLSNATAAISREDGKIQITVDSDLEQ